MADADPLRLRGRAALVTGGLGGIGGAIARRLTREGARVFTADLAGRPSGADYLRLDVTSEADWRAAAEAIAAAAGGLDMLVNNAGVAPTGPIPDFAPAEWRRVMAVNAEGAFLGMRALAPLLEAGARARDGWSSVVNLSSILGIVGFADSAGYAASKGALRALSKAAAIEFARAGRRIRVNSLHPGFVRTAMTLAGAEALAEGQDLLGQLGAATPMGRVAEADEIAAACYFLASDESSFMTGAELVIDGGWTAQ